MWRLPSLTPSPTAALSVFGQFNIEAWPQNPPSRNRLMSCRRLRREPSPSPTSSSSRSMLASPPDRKAGSSPEEGPMRRWTTSMKLPTMTSFCRNFTSNPFCRSCTSNVRNWKPCPELKLLKDAATVQEPISASEITVARLWSLEIFDSAELGELIPNHSGFAAIGTGGEDFVQAMVVAVESVIQQPIPQAGLVICGVSFGLMGYGCAN
ncbi:hypothetical protein E2542_SST11923 [Spatholobus suberectus]|nr:hypothetical protein E2542_SST11923 [Spatholobus suberectus]